MSPPKTSQKQVNETIILSPQRVTFKTPPPKKMGHIANQPCFTLFFPVDRVGHAVTSPHWEKMHPNVPKVDVHVEVPRFPMVRMVKPGVMAVKRNHTPKTTAKNTVFIYLYFIGGTEILSDMPPNNG